MGPMAGEQAGRIGRRAGGFYQSLAPLVGEGEGSLPAPAAALGNGGTGLGHAQRRSACATSAIAHRRLRSHLSVLSSVLPASLPRSIRSMSVPQIAADHSNSASSTWARMGVKGEE